MGTAASLQRRTSAASRAGGHVAASSGSPAAQRPQDESPSKGRAGQRDSAPADVNSGADHSSQGRVAQRAAGSAGLMPQRRISGGPASAAQPQRDSASPLVQHGEVKTYSQATHRLASVAGESKRALPHGNEAQPSADGQLHAAEVDGSAKPRDDPIADEGLMAQPIECRSTTAAAAPAGGLVSRGQGDDMQAAGQQPTTVSADLRLTCSVPQAMACLSGTGDGSAMAHMQV